MYLCSVGDVPSLGARFGSSSLVGGGGWLPLSRPGKIINFADLRAGSGVVFFSCFVLWVGVRQLALKMLLLLPVPPSLLVLANVPLAQPPVTWPQANAGFLRAAVVRSDADALLLPLLRTLHDCVSAEQQQQELQRRRWTKMAAAAAAAAAGADPSPPVLYVPAIVVLLFSQDAAFNRQSFRQVVQGDVVWGPARNVRGASLGSLIVLSTLRCLGHNLKRYGEN